MSAYPLKATDQQTCRYFASVPDSDIDSGPLQRRHTLGGDRHPPSGGAGPIATSAARQHAISPHCVSKPRRIDQCADKRPSSLLKNPRHSECIVIQFFYHESAGAGMRGAFMDQGGLFSYIAPE